MICNRILPFVQRTWLKYLHNACGVRQGGYVKSELEENVIIIQIHRLTNFIPTMANFIQIKKLDCSNVLCQILIKLGFCTCFRQAYWQTNQSSLIGQFVSRDHRSTWRLPGDFKRFLIILSLHVLYLVLGQCLSYIKQGIFSLIGQIYQYPT